MTYALNERLNPIESNGAREPASVEFRTASDYVLWRIRSLAEGLLCIGPELHNVPTACSKHSARGFRADALQSQ